MPCSPAAAGSRTATERNFEHLRGSALLRDLGGKVWLAATGNEEFPALLPGLPGTVVAGTIAVIFIVIAWKLPDK